MTGQHCLEQAATCRGWRMGKTGNKHSPQQGCQRSTQGTQRRQPHQPKGPSKMPTYHVGGNLIRRVSIQVELECHHLVVVCLQLTLHHLVTRVAHLRDTGVVRPGRRLLPASHVPTGPPRLAPHIQDGQPGTAGPLLARARARGPAVMFPGGLAFQLPPTKCALTAVTQLSSRSDVRTSIAAGKPRMLLRPQKRPAMQAGVMGEVWLFRK